MGTIVQELTRIQTAKSNLKTAIEAKGVTVPSATTIDGYATLVGQIQTGATEAEENDVNFYDYDGFRVASFTIAEAKALTALPIPPTHQGLTFEEWNWTLNDIATYNRRYIDIGANYKTNDHDTHIKVEVEANDSVFFKLSVDTGLKIQIQWGDGNSETAATGTISVSHIYSTSGSYEIILHIAENTVATAKYSFFDLSIGIVKNFREINIGDNFSFSGNTNFQFIQAKVSFPKDIGIEEIGVQNSIIPVIAIPKGSHSFTGNNQLRNTTSKICMPKTIGTISGSGFFLGITTNRLVVPEINSGSLYNNTFASNNFMQILSLPLSLQFASSGNFFNSCSSLAVIDIAQGWVPNYDITFSVSNHFDNKSIVDFFTKLGTTSTTRTLTFGSNNLGRLSADDKAIATNKGYTLA